MKFKNYKYFVIGITIFFSFISISSLFNSNEKNKKSNIIINYDKNTVSDECNNSNEIKTPSDNPQDTIEPLPLPNTNDSIIINAL